MNFFEKNRAKKKYATLVTDIPAEVRRMVYYGMFIRLTCSSIPNGFCAALDYARKEEYIAEMVKKYEKENEYYPGLIGVGLDMFPEVWCYKPKKFFSNYWFPLSPIGIAKRVEILELAIKKCDELKKNNVLIK